MEYLKGEKVVKSKTSCRIAARPAKLSAAVTFRDEKSKPL